MCQSTPATRSSHGGWPPTRQRGLTSQPRRLTRGTENLGGIRRSLSGEVVRSTPPDWYARDEQTKFPLRAAMRAHLPAEVLAGRQRGFSRRR